MKRWTLIIAVLGGAIALGWWWFVLRQRSGHDKQSAASMTGNKTGGAEHAKDGDAPTAPPKGERLRMSREARIELLERLGCVPADADESDFRLAAQTRWWGKRLDPQKFWAGRVIWVDGSARSLAWRYGRSYPPMPFEDPRVANRSDLDRRPTALSLEDSNIPYVWNEREQAFWTNFRMEHPLPPNELEHEQWRLAEIVAQQRDLLVRDPQYAKRIRLTADEVQKLVASKQQDGAVVGYPQEMYDEDALFSVYVATKRQEYENVVASGDLNNPILASNFWRRVYVDSKYITEPLSEAEVAAANAWKIAYLRRLAAEKVDVSYINAYLQAWNLSSNQVFSTR